MVHFRDNRDTDVLRSTIHSAHLDLNMVAPFNDTDMRSKNVWGVIEASWKRGDCQIFFRKDFDYKKLVDPMTYKHMSFFQVRSNHKLQERVKNNKIKFFGAEPEELRKAPIIFKFDDGGKTIYCPIVGNGRGYCFRSEQVEMPAIIVDCEGMAINDVLQFAFEAASRSNESDPDDVEPETQDCYIQQLATKEALLKLANPKFTSEELESELDSWLSRKVKYSKPESAAHRKSLINKALGNGRADALPDPDEETVERNWKRFFRGGFNMSKTDKVLKIKNNGYFADVERTLYAQWKNRNSSSRMPAWLTLRVGTDTGKAITEVKAVLKGRKKLLDQLTSYNKHPKLEACEFPIIQKVMFVKQLAGDDDYTAYEWNPDEECFMECEEQNTFDKQ